MLSNNEIVAIEYKGGIPEYNNELKIKELQKKLRRSFDEVFILKTSQRFSIYVYANAFLSTEGCSFTRRY
jgi:glutamyl-tRNA reductase